MPTSLPPTGSRHGPRARGSAAAWRWAALLPGVLLAGGSRADDSALAKPFDQQIPSAAYAITMLPIPGSADGKVRPLWMSRTEVTWEAVDVYAFRLDLPENADFDAQSRPTKPYLPPDRGFGHEGYAAISMTHKSCVKFCEWLSLRSGRRYRLATEAEWEHACRAGGPASARYPTGDDAAGLGEFAWFKDNANGSPQPVGKKKPNAWGLCDMLGNVREWVDGADGKPTTKGGCYLSGADELAVDARTGQDRTWNQTDPQIPKSTWWLSDGPFAGFRIVCESDPADPSRPARTPPATGTIERPSDQPAPAPGGAAPKEKP